MTSHHDQYDIAIIGAGIAGMAHALEAAKQGLKVIVFERHPKAKGSSVQNFGMFFPFGTSPGIMRDRALRSREVWRTIAEETDIWVGEVGSLLMAHRPEAWRVLQEFQANPPADNYDTELLTVEEVLERFPSVNPDRLEGGLFTNHEMSIDPREAIAKLPAYLEDKYEITFAFSTPVTEIDLPTVTAGGETYSVDYAVVCGGTEFETLYPETYKNGHFIRCNLQMLKTESQPTEFDMQTMMVGTLTMQHYPTFDHCPSLPALKETLSAEYQHLIERGIHVMAVQNERREIVLGDSHDYGWMPELFSDEQTDDYILDYLQEMIQLPSMKISQRWIGTYSKHTSQTMAIETPAENVRILCMGGLGMTLSFGAAQDVIQEMLQAR